MIHRNLRAFLGGATITLASVLSVNTSSMAAEETLKSREGVHITVENLTSGLNHPWGMTFLPDGRLLITERNTGNLYIMGADNTLSQAVEGVPEVYAQGQGGLLDVALHPHFDENNYVYMTFAEQLDNGKARTALGRGKFINDRIEGFEKIFEQDMAINGSKHFGSRIAFSPDNQYLFIALGERFQFDPAQDLSNTLGKVLRLNLDGSVPDDNPFAGQENADPAIWSYGHRNIQAMDVQPETGELWVVEMGPMGGDELNHIQKGKNYGWPVVSWGDNYDGTDIPDPDTRPEFEDAAKQWTPVISPSGMDFYEGDMFPEFKGSALIGGLSSTAVIKVDFNGTEVTGEERFDLEARIRDVVEAPDGSIYLLTDQDDGDVWRMSRMQ